MVAQAAGSCPVSDSCKKSFGVTSKTARRL